MSRIILRDGRVAELLKAEDTEVHRALIRNLFQSASPESLYLRFFHAVREVSEKIISSMISDGGPNGLSLLCLAGTQAIAIGTYSRVDAQSAEAAFFVGDAYHGNGLGSLLLAHLAQAAWRNGFRRFEAYVLHENEQMLKVFQASGYELVRRTESTMMHLILPLRETERSRALQETREKFAAAASLHPFFRPNTVAVVGASRDPNRAGHLLLHHVVDGGYTGIATPVNRSTAAVSAMRTYPSLASLPEPPDLAIVAVPADQVPVVIEDCIEAQVRAVMVVSAGFGEVDAAGREKERELARKLRAAGIRLIGPNCLGLVNTAPDVQLNASLAPRLPSVGKLAIASHSGALGVAILEYASVIGVGVSSFVSLGNKVDVSANDLLQFWEDDANVDMIVLYLESFGNPRKFARIARRVAGHKPILVVKSARTPGGSAISRLPGAQEAAVDSVVGGLFRQAGIIRLDTLQELFDVAALLAVEPKPQGRRVAVVTNTAGGAVMTADTLQREGLSFVGPVINLGFEALADSYREVLPQVLRDHDVDAVVVLFTPVAISDEEEVIAAIGEAIEMVDADPEDGMHLRPSQKPVVANFLSHGDYHVRTIVAGQRRIPVYPFPEQAVHALARVTEYVEDGARLRGRIPDLPGCDVDGARDLVRGALGDGKKELSGAQAHDVLGRVGIDCKMRPVPALRAGDETLRIEVRPHALFGPVVHVTGSGGSVFRMTPLTDIDAADMVTSVKAPEAVADVLLRVSRLAEEVPEVYNVTLGHLQVLSDAPSACMVGDASLSVREPDIGPL
ncbi:GNAT family N-acetyltransferase [Alicyclobacillus sp. ALC3]|uniref:GNAT family N-acetyltransferase n=1 Tax=Alicyclobacillus sp. ALC3 TaxID=2796143 RepID=UPI002378EECB|nr:GNAT family N-acetyltransferase [Alicyclobacillus sp. ALC3]WDL95765.1 GNAT family N-acetyltransferase [Alicyclobacillus sp. ALC3]